MFRSTLCSLLLRFSLSEVSRYSTMHRCGLPPHRSLPAVFPHKPLHGVLPQTGLGWAKKASTKSFKVSACQYGHASTSARLWSGPPRHQRSTTRSQPGWSPLVARRGR